MSYKRGQVTIFIIIAVIILALVGGYFLLRGTTTGSNAIPADIQPAYTSFLSCLQQDTSSGIGILETRGGYIDLPPFEPGNTYMPFSSQLYVAGVSVPYWYYVSGNNIAREQVPSQSDMESALSDFIDQRIRQCNLQDFYDQGFVITMQDPKASVSIKDSSVDVNLDMQMTIQKGNQTTVIKSHSVSVPSPLGTLYSSAKKVYDTEQQSMFLENYTIDDLRLYAPVDGVEITCGPLKWNADSVFDTLQSAVEANTLALKSPGKSTDYFTVELPVTQKVRFLTSSQWPNSYEVTPSEGHILTAQPVGNQPGLGSIGFCYVPYHFVYNIKYPVLIQVYSDSGSDVFQFPFAVVIQGNNPRQALNVTASPTPVPQLCQYNNTEIQVNTYDSDGNPIDANISYECLSNTCDLGSTQQGTLSTGFPQCANGYVVADADGFKESRYLFSTVQQGSVDMFLDRLYPMNIRLSLAGKAYNGQAIITLSSDAGTQTIYYPDQKTVDVSAGQYNIEAQFLVNSSIKVGATTKQQCVSVPNGLLGIVGISKQQCYEINIPEQVISNALIGGGNTTTYFTLDKVALGKTLEIDGQSFPTPDSLDQVEQNYALLDQSQLDIQLK